MTKRGRPPKAEHLRVIEGDVGHRGKAKHEERAPIARPGKPTRPAWLLKEARPMWKLVVDELDRMGVLTVMDGYKLAACAQSWGWYVKHEKAKAEHFAATGGLVFVTPKGYKQQIPEVSMARQALQDFHSLGSDLGLSPVDRARLIGAARGGKKKSEDDMEDLLEETGG